MTLFADSPKGEKTLTPEQAAIVAHDPASTMIVEAFAGTGKTSTLVEYAKKWNAKGLYLAFNKAIADEARGRFPSNVTAKTAHAYAYHALGVSKYASRTENKIRWQHIREAKLNLHNLYLSEERTTKALLEALHNFMIDAGPELLPHHAGLEGAPERTQAAVMPLIGAAVNRFVNFQDSGLPFTHDMYLKHLEMFGGISKEYDYLLVDEAQDLNPVLISLVEKSGLPAIVVGDPWQSIYAFRGAVSAMRAFSAPRLPLSQSWRFGPEVATLANHILSFSNEPPERPVVGRPGHSTSIERYKGIVPGRCFILARTNARLFEGLINVTKPFNVAGGFDNLSSQLMSAWNLSNGNKWEVRDPLVRMFNTWEEFVQEGEDGDVDAKRLTKIITDYGDEIPEIIGRLRLLHKPNPRDAAIRLSTAHKAKGLEAEAVMLLDDFETPAELKEKVIEGKSNPVEYDQEINLLYVAHTRASHRLMLPDKLHDAFAQVIDTPIPA